MASRQGGTLGGFTPLSTPNAPTDLSVSTSIGSASVSFTAPTDTGDAAVTSYIVTAIDESTGASAGATGSASPITVSPGGGTFKIRAQAVNGFGPGRLTEFDTGNAIYSGAELYAWGAATDGRRGDNNTTISKSSPIQVGALTNWSHLSNGSATATAIKTDGTLWAWGYNGFGQIGNGTVISRSSPVQVGALTSWYYSVAFGRNAAAIKTDGTLWAWGYGFSGQLGQNNTISRSSPVQVGLLTNWTDVAIAGNPNGAMAAVQSNGTMWSWGHNEHGKLGQNISSLVYRSSPVQIGSLTTWYQVSGGSQFMCSIKTDGTLWAWGQNNTGQLGDNSIVSRSSPVQVGALTGWSKVSCGNEHTVAIKTNGTLWMWGRNSSGELGDNTIINRSSPVQIGALTTWALPSAGYAHVLATKTDGTIWAWGQGGAGALGDGTNANKSSPVQIGASTDWYQPSAGQNFSLAILGVV
jgi:alpha-tubulin suppressor-like RCC1 family protein